MTNHKHRTNSALFPRGKRAAYLINLIVVLSFLWQPVAYLLAQSPDEAPLANPADRVVETWQDDGRFTYEDASPTPLPPPIQLPTAANDLAELLPAGLPAVTAVAQAGSYSATIDPAGTAVSFPELPFILIADAGAVDAAVTVNVTPQTAVPTAEEGGIAGSVAAYQLSFTAADGLPVVAFHRPVYIAIDLRKVEGMPEAPEAWFLAFRDDNEPLTWRYHTATAHDEAGLISAAIETFIPTTATLVAGGVAEGVAVALDNSLTDDPLPNDGTPSPWRYQWQLPTVSSFSGAATVSYPIPVPPGRAGLQPNIDISYSSRGLDALTFTDGMDQGVLGLGWSLNNIQISRDNTKLLWDGAHYVMHHGDLFSLVLNGQSHRLFWLSTSGNTRTYYALNAPQLRVRQIYDPNAAGSNSDKIYWTVQTADGTTYRLGYTEDAETGQTVWPASMLQTMGNQAAGARTDYGGLRWLVDTVTDVHGNQIQYDYSEWSEQAERYEQTPGVNGDETDVTTSRAALQEVRYNYANLAADANTRVSGAYASKITFTLLATRLLDKINLYHLDLTAPYKVFNVQVDGDSLGNTACGQGGRPNIIRRVSTIREENGDGSLFLPATTYTPVTLSHNTNNPECHRFSYLQEVNNGYGGRIRFTYTADGRFSGNTNVPDYGQSYFVTQTETWDGIHAAAAVTSYNFQFPCYDQADGNVGTLPGAVNCLVGDYPYPFDLPHGALVGFAQTTITSRDYDGTILNTQFVQFRRGLNRQDPNDPDYRGKAGRPYHSQLKDADNFVLQQSDTTYATDTGTAFNFTYTASECATTYVRGGQSSQQCKTYTYGRQGGIQYGNLTHTEEEGYLGGVANQKRLVYREYYPNTNRWIVGAVAREAVYTGTAGQPINPASSNPITESRNYYDDSASWNAAPAAGKVTQVEQMQENAVTVIPPSPTPPPPTLTPLPPGPPPAPTALRAEYYPYCGALNSLDSEKMMMPSNTEMAPEPTPPPDEDCVYLTWTPPQLDQLTFQLYRNTVLPVPIDDAHRIGAELAGTSFYDNNGEEGNYYVVTAVRGRDESEPSYPAQAVNCFPICPDGPTGQKSSTEGLTAVYAIVQTIGYDSYGNATLVTDANGNDTAVTYDGTYHLYPVSTSNELGHTQLYGYNYLNASQNNTPPGSLREARDANGLWTYYFYDAYGRLERVFRGWTEQGGDWTKPSEVYRYNDTDTPLRITSWRKTQDNAADWSNGGVFERTFYDGFGNPIQVQAPHTNWSGNAVTGANTGQRRVVDTVYNAAGQAISQSEPYYATAYGGSGSYYVTPSATARKISSAYDAAGHTVRTVGLDGSVTSAVFGNRSLYSQDANNHIKASYVDAAGQLVAVDETVGRFSDDFGDGVLNNWNQGGTVSESGGMAHLTGNNTWNTYLWRTLSAAGDAGTAFSFRSSNASIVSHMLLDYGAWGASAYRRWSLSTVGGQVALQEYVGSTMTQTTLMPFKANTWYRAVLKNTQSSADNVLVVWEADNPAQMAEIRLAKDSTWKQPGWRLMLQVYTSGATLDVDNYDELEFNRTSYQYDLVGNLTRVTDPFNNVTQMIYDAAGRKRTMSDPDMGQWYYAYDNAGNLRSQTDAKVQTIAFEYDALNRLAAKRQGLGGAYLATYSYDDIAGGNKGLGQRTGMTAYYPPGVPHNSASWRYDILGRVTQETRQVAGNTYAFAFAYTQGDVPVTVTYPGGSSGQAGEVVTTNYYWQTGQPKTHIGDSNYVQEAQYNRADGQLTRLNMPSSSIYTTFGYDSFSLRLNAIRTYSGSATRFRYAYTYDLVGNITSILDYVPPGGGSTQTQTFTYDTLNRLTRAYTSGGNAGQYDESYSYNALGNLENKGGVSYTYSGGKPHAVTHLNSVQKYWYDANGNMTRRIDGQNRDWALGWTPENMLQTATNNQNDALRFIYDADGMLLLRVEDEGQPAEQKTVHLGKIFEHNLTLNSYRKHYLFAGRLVAIREGLSSGSGVSYLATDALGSVTTTLFANGTIKAQKRYKPFGEERYSQNSTPTGQRFTGQRWDEGLGLYDYNARYYDPVNGRFISADTIVPDHAGPQSLNRFAYVVNNPIKFTDPSGHHHNDLKINDLHAFISFQVALQEHIEWKNEVFDNINEVAFEAGLAAGAGAGFFSGGPFGAALGAALGGAAGKIVGEAIPLVTGDLQIRDDLVNLRNRLETDFLVNQEDGTFSVYVEDEGYKPVSSISITEVHNLDSGYYSAEFSVTLDDGRVVIKRYDFKNDLTYHLVIEDLINQANQNGGFLSSDEDI